MFPYENGDRVVATVNGAMAKGRVTAIVPQFEKVAISFHKGTAPQLFPAAQVFPLYRYVNGGKGVVLLAAAAGK